MRSRSVREAGEQRKTEVARGLLRRRLLRVGDDVVLDVLRKHAKRDDPRVGKVVLDGRIEAGGLGRLQVRIAGDDVATGVHDGGRRDLAEARPGDRRGEGHAPDQVGGKLVSQLRAGEEVVVGLVGRDGADRRAIGAELGA